MAITSINMAVAAGTSVTPPSHASGDLLVFFAYRGVSASAISSPDLGYCNLWLGGTSNSRMRIEFAIADSSSEVSGTWSGADQVGCFVIKSDTFIGVGTHILILSNMPSLVYPAFNESQPIRKPNARIIGMVANRAGDATFNYPSGWTPTSISQDGTSNATGSAALVNSPLLSAYAQETLSGTSSVVGNRIHLVDILDTGISKSSGGPSGPYNPFRPPVFGGR